MSRQQSFAAHRMDSARASAEKLSQKRQSAAAARSRTQALHLKLLMAVGVIFAGALGAVIYYTGMQDEALAKAKLEANAQLGAKARFGEVRVPVSGNTCQALRFDNKTGQPIGEGLVPCEDPPARAAAPPPTQASARAAGISSGFKFKQ